MKTIGLVISHKNNEMRRALLPEDLKNIDNVSHLYFEKNYGNALGYEDQDYLINGANIVSREKALNCPIIVDVKLGDADYLETIRSGSFLCGWSHAVQNIAFTNQVLNASHTVLAWEELYEKGRYLFYRNRELAGEAAVLHAFRYCGKMPYDCRVAIIGNGQTAKGAFRILSGLGAEVDIYPRKHELLFRENMANYDVLINCVMWDTSRTDRLIYRSDLKRLSKGTLIIDISCDPYLEIETSHPTTIDDPVYDVDGIIHYAVDNTPAMFPKTATICLSKIFSQYVDYIIEERHTDSMKHATVIEKGEIKFQPIRDYREARGLFCK